MQSTRGSSILAVPDFDVVVARTEQQLHAAYRLRHQVYCIERGFEPGEGAIETDRFDPRSRHALLIQRTSGQPVGTVRVVGRGIGHCEDDFPMQPLCAPEVFRAVAETRAGEISRFAISRRLRDNTGANSVPLRLGLMRGIVQISAAMNITHWCALMERTLLRLLGSSGIHFSALGPAIEYRGLRQPSWGSIDEILGRMRRECPAVWDYVTDRGRLWHCPDMAAAA